jgi:hypothetical protein
MSKLKEINSHDSKDRFHGYQQWYYRNVYTNNRELSFRGNVKHNMVIGYIETHEYQETRFHII